MASDQSFWREVRVHATAGVIVSVLGAIGLAWWGLASGWLRAVLDWTLTAVPALGEAIWTTLLYPASIPVWVLLLAAGTLVVIFRWVAATSAQETITHVGPSVAAPVRTLLGLGELELQILRMLALADGRSFPFEELAQLLNTRRLLLDQSVDILIKRDLIHTHPGSYGSTAISLTAAGRDFVIQQGFVGAS